MRGAFVCGTTGEGQSLTSDERRQVAARWCAAAPKHFRVIVHVGHASLAEAKALAAHAAQIGAAAVAATPPYFYKPRTAEDVAACCAEIAAAAPGLPFYYYHFPDITGIDIMDTGTADHFVRMAKSVKLLGADCVLTGINPHIARTLVQMDVQLTGITT